MLEDGQILFTLPTSPILRDGIDDTNLKMNALLLPPCVAVISLVVFLGHIAYTKLASVKFGPNNARVSGRSSLLDKYYSASHERFLSTFLGTIQCVCCAVLLVFQVYLLDEHTIFPPSIRYGECATYAYASLLGVLTLTSHRSSVAQDHLNVVLMCPWAVYMYRDVWPLATYTSKPSDIVEGTILWVRLGVLTLAAVIIPLVRPREYIPYDPADPMQERNPEQTASLLSGMLYLYMDSVVISATRTSHLTLDQLPPLPDVDYMKNLESRGFKHIDPLIASKRHLFWNLLHVFFWEHVQLVFLLLMLVIANLISPFGMNRILTYLESGGEGATVRPWVWVLVLFLAPVVQSVIANMYMWLMGKVLARVQAMVTQVIFDHALRIRLKTDIEEASTLTTAANTPDTRSTVDGNESDTVVGDALESRHSEEQSTSRSAGSTVAPPSAGSQSHSQGASVSNQKGDGKSGTATTKDSNMIGKINNLVTSDLNSLEAGTTFILVGFFTPFAIIFSVVFLYVLLGWSVFVGIGTMLVMLSIPGLVVKLSHSIQVEKMKKSDSRVQTVTEAMGGVMRMVKLFGWESKMGERIDHQRQEELKVIRKFRILTVISNNVNNLIPILTMAVTFVTYTLIMKKTLTASRVFSSMAVFQMLQLHFRGVTLSIPVVIQAKVALDRMNDFLQKSELLDAFSDISALPAISEASETDLIGIRAASFTWSKDTEGTSTPSMQHKFKLQIDNEVFFKRGHINLIIGQTASGKTSLLMALLGEMHYLPMGPSSLVSLPRGNGIAYHAQESWVLNETIRNNILFGSTYDEDRYKAVIKQCALERDLALFDAGDETEVGEKGITLSGGQKARITLARAIYSSAEILLLDDVLAALDVHTAQWIVEKCFQGDLVRGRTVILVTHNVALASPIADFVVALRDGRVISQGSLSSALEKDKKLSAAVVKETEQLAKTEEEVTEAKLDPADNAQSSGKLVVAEEITEGHLGWSALKLLLGNMGAGAGFVLFWLFYVVPIFVAKMAAVLDQWVLGLWARQYEIQDPTQVSISYYISLYIAVVTTGMLLTSIGYAVFVFGTVRASRVIHRTLINTLLHSTLRWLDKTPTARIISRCTQDIAAIDGPVVNFLHSLIEMTFELLIKLGAIVFMSPIFVFPGILMAIAMGWMGQLYMKAQLAVKRERSNARSPVLGHFGAAISGLVSIRAYGAQAAFRQESFVRTDRYTRATLNFWNLNRWIGVRGEILAGMFAAALAAYLVYGQRYDASRTGFSLTMAISFSTMILWWVRIFNEFEVQGNSLERIQQYLIVDQEDKPSPEGIPPAHWPSSGDLKVEKLSARYYEGGPEVLHDISFEVKSGERIGVVGRTGSGKSSLTLALLRCILTEGTVYFDGLPTNRVNLDALRSHITIIPQVPELLTGTLRENIDPFSQYDDAVLNDALRAAGLFSLQNESEEGRLTLDSAISSGGGNLSVGQRQIIALARAIVRQSKLLILDEATSAIDYETDAVIQESLRKEVASDVTLLTVAHRLQTIMDADKIMVLDAGRIAEFGKPSELLRNAEGFLRSLVDASGDKEKLYAMAGVDV